MEEKFIQYVEKHALFSPGDGVVVGVSGGADSVCLLRLLAKYRERWQLQLYVVHVNHGIRGEEARRDSIFVQQLAQRWNIPFFLVEKDIPVMAKENNMTEEEAGRLVRYEEMEKVRRKQNARWIAVGHHQNDQAETLLFQLFRGSGAGGLAGMHPKRGVIIRPLLWMRREQIEQYLQENQLSYCEDSTNTDIQYSRNWLRHQLIPQIEKNMNEKAVIHMAETAEDVGVWSSYVEEQGKKARMIIEKRKNDVILLDKKKFLAEHEAVQFEILRQVLEQFPGGKKDIRRVHYRKIQQLFFAENGKQINLPRKLVAKSSYKGVCVYSEQAEKREQYCLECAVPSVNIVDIDKREHYISLEVKKRFDLPQEIPQKDYTKWLDYDKIKGNLRLRTMETGDYFIFDKEGHRKKLSKYYRDKKMTDDEKKRKLVLAEESKALWVIPERISADCKVTNNTKNVLVVTLSEIEKE